MEVRYITDKLFCSRCPRKRRRAFAKMLCHDCDEALCDECLKPHLQLRTYATHLLKSIDDTDALSNDIKCHKTSEEGSNCDRCILKGKRSLATTLCEDCEESLCDKCMLPHQQLRTYSSHTTRIIGKDGQTSSTTTQTCKQLNKREFVSTQNQNISEKSNDKLDEISGVEQSCRNNKTNSVVLVENSTQTEIQRNDLYPLNYVTADLGEEATSHEDIFKQEAKLNRDELRRPKSEITPRRQIQNMPSILDITRPFGRKTGKSASSISCKSMTNYMTAPVQEGIERKHKHVSWCIEKPKAIDELPSTEFVHFADKVDMPDNQEKVHNLSIHLPTSSNSALSQTERNVFINANKIEEKGCLREIKTDTHRQTEATDNEYQSRCPENKPGIKNHNLVVSYEAEAPTSNDHIATGKSKVLGQYSKSILRSNEKAKPIITVRSRIPRYVKLSRMPAKLQNHNDNKDDENKEEQCREESPISENCQNIANILKRLETLGKSRESKKRNFSIRKKDIKGKITTTKSFIHNNLDEVQNIGSLPTNTGNRIQTLKKQLNFQ